MVICSNSTCCNALSSPPVTAEPCIQSTFSCSCCIFVAWITCYGCAIWYFCNLTEHREMWGDEGGCQLCLPGSAGLPGAHLRPLATGCLLLLRSQQHQGRNHSRVHVTGHHCNLQQQTKIPICSCHCTQQQQSRSHCGYESALGLNAKDCERGRCNIGHFLLAGWVTCFNNKPFLRTPGLLHTRLRCQRPCVAWSYTCGIVEATW